MAKTTKKSTAEKSTPENFLERANIVHVLSYFPYLIGAIGMYFVGQSDKKQAMHHIKYSGMMGAAAIIGHILLQGSIIGWFIFPVYMIASGIFAWKAYNGEDVNVDLFDTIEDKISEKVKK